MTFVFQFDCPLVMLMNFLFINKHFAFAGCATLNCSWIVYVFLLLFCLCVLRTKLNERQVIAVDVVLSISHVARSYTNAHKQAFVDIYCDCDSRDGEHVWMREREPHS